MSNGWSTGTLGEAVRRHARRIGRSVQVLVALVLLGVVLSMVEWGRFLELVARAAPGWLALVFLIGLADRLFMAGKWLFLLRRLGVQLGFGSALAHYFLGGLVGVAAQWQLGGDIARAVRAARETGRAGTVAASIFLEKLVGLSALGCLAVISTLLLNLRLGFAGWPLVVAGSAVALAAFSLLPFLIVQRASLALVGRLGTLMPFHRLRVLSSQLPSLRESHARLPSVVGMFFVLTLMEQLAPPATVFALAVAFGFELTLLEILATVPIMVFLSRLPISIESLGVREGLFVFFLGLVGLDATQSFLMALATRLVDLLLVAAGAAATLALTRHRAVEEGSTAHP